MGAKLVADAVGKNPDDVAIANNRGAIRTVK